MRFVAMPGAVEVLGICPSGHLHDHSQQLLAAERQSMHVCQLGYGVRSRMRCVRSGIDGVEPKAKWGSLFCASRTTDL